jgi:hypothetical protein
MFLDRPEVTTQPPIPDPASLNSELRDELHRRVGRNLLLFQAIEHAWKAMLRAAEIEGAFDGMSLQPTPSHAARQYQIGQSTMGTVLRELFERVLVDPQPTTAASHDESSPNAPLVRSRWTIESSPDAPDTFHQLQQGWQALVDERNLLIHQSLVEWQVRLPGEISAVLEELDAQRERARSVLDFLKSLVTQTDSAGQALSAWMVSEAGREASLFAQAALDLMGRLCEIAFARGDKDGWTFVTTAGHLLRGEDVDRVRQVLGRDWLSTLLRQASDTFELRAEPIPNGAAGAVRWLYRVRQDAPDMLSITLTEAPSAPDSTGTSATADS